MAINISAGDMDLIWDAIESIVGRAAAGDVAVEDATSEIIGLIDLAATDNPTFMESVKGVANANRT